MTQNLRTSEEQPSLKMCQYLKNIEPDELMMISFKSNENFWPWFLMKKIRILHIKLKKPILKALHYLFDRN